MIKTILNGIKENNSESDRSPAGGGGRVAGGLRSVSRRNRAVHRGQKCKCHHLDGIME